MSRRLDWVAATLVYAIRSRVLLALDFGPTGLLVASQGRSVSRPADNCPEALVNFSPRKQKEVLFVLPAVVAG